ncbi:hypothetical protein [Kurthia sibirica]|nr:hypothetical protein [Kurthia sibirica]GEK35551.1 hypothetical protein KSI01_30840 [Kurthia sibirica]
MANNKPPMKWEVGVIRFEVCIEKAHLQYQKSKKGEERNLRNYFRKAKYQGYMEKYLFKIFPTGDFYSYSDLESIIYKLSEKPNIKNNMKKFVKLVSNGNLDRAANEYSPNTYRKYMKLFNGYG